MQAPSRFPFVERDLALIVKENVKAGDIIRVIKKAGKSLVKDVTVFDVYKGEHIDEGYVSIAIKIKYQNEEKTLQEKEILEAETAIKEALFKEFSIVLRG
jgi:phenylalanyl-tRNA synthetase beta chain